MTTNDRLSPGAARRLRRALRLTMLVLAGFVLVGPVSQVVAQTVDPPRAVVQGTVFKDHNGNGELDDNEAGVEGVSVSDGVDIVQTDADGRYRLAIDVERRRTDVVFITQPAGYQVPTDDDMTPRFYRNLGDVADDDEVTADFSLIPDPASNSANFSFANVADPHVNPKLPEQIAEINNTATDLGFIQVSGDLTNSATDGEFETYLSATAGSSVPVWPAVGNHEYHYAGGSDYASRIDNYRQHVGPEWYSFDYGDRHFLVLENNGQAPFDEQLDWARRDLEANAEGKRLVVLTHQPMNVPFGSPSQYDAYGDLLEQYDAELVLVGHEHSNDAEPDSTFAPGAKHVQTNSSSYTIDSSPRGFRYVHMRGERFENPFRMYGVDQMLTVTDPAPDAVIPHARFTGVQVNAYDTTDEIRGVRYRVDGGPWRKLRSTGEFTWHADWKGPRLDLGEHRLDVRVTGPDRNSWSSSSTFTLIDEQPAAPSAGADWPQHHGDPGHTGVADDTLGPALQLAWSYRTPGTFLTGSPVIVDGVVYAGTRDENGDGASAVHAVDLATGEQLWEFPVPSSVHGTVAVTDGRVFVPSLRGTLFALDAADGSLLWQRDPEPGTASANQRSYSYYSPTIADGKVLWAYQTRLGKASQGLLTALEPATGEAVWEAPMTGATMSDGTPAVADGKVFVGNQTADRVIAYDLDTGQRMWVSSRVLGGWQDGVPTAANGRVFIGSNDGIVARDAETGQDLWTYRSPHASYVSSGSTPSAPAVAGNVVYMGFPSGSVTAFDARTGALLWDRRLPGDTYHGGVHSSPIVSGDTVFVGANNGLLYALDRQTGQPLWQYEIGTWVAAGPALSGNTLVAGAWDGNLYAFTPGGEAAPRWATVTGTVTDAVSGEAVPGTRVAAVLDGAEHAATTTDDEGRYVFALEPGTYTISTARRGYLGTDGSSGTVEVGSSGEHALDLELVEVTEPVAGNASDQPHYGAGTTRPDVTAGDTYHYAMNRQVQATVSSRSAQNNQPGTFRPGSLSDLFLLDGTAAETLDWSEMILAETSNDPSRPWGRDGEWLDLPDIEAEGDTVTASGTAQVDDDLRTQVSYRTLPGAPVVKATLTVENTGSEDFDGYFQYLLDPDSSDDSALIPGVSGVNPGFVASGWTDNYVYVGPRSKIPSPAHAVAWLDDQPTGLTAFGYIAGAWFEADVPAGGTRTISWYHITDYPGAGSPTANVARWATQLDLLDPEVPDRARAAGNVTRAETGQPAGGVGVVAFDDSGNEAGTAWTNDDGQYALALEPGTYTLRVSTLGYATASTTVEVTEGTTTEGNLSLQPVTVSAETGRTLIGGRAEAGTDGVVIENARLALAVSRSFDDPQLPGSTVGKPVDMAVQGHEDQIDWLNLPYVASSQPEGTEAWQQTSIRTTDVEIVQSSGDQAVVTATGESVAHPGLHLVTTYTIRPDQPWVTAETRFENRGDGDLSLWVGDVIDHDGGGQHSGVAGHGSVTTPYSDPREYDPDGPWVGMSGTDPQTYGLVYGESAPDWTAYGNGNWIMSRIPLELSAGDEHVLTRRIVATEAGPDRFAVLDELATE